MLHFFPREKGIGKLWSSGALIYLGKKKTVSLSKVGVPRYGMKTGNQSNTLIYFI